MDILNMAEVKALAEEYEPPCISIFMPGRRPGMDSGGDAIRFKNHLRQAQEQLSAMGLREREIADLLAPGWHLYEDKAYWSRQSDGFACFIARGMMRYFRLPAPFSDRVVVNRRFYLKPLLELLGMDGHFWLLALAEKHNRLLYCSRYGAWQTLVSDMPPNMQYSLRFDDPEIALQHHATSGGPGPGRPTEMFHGHGAHKDARLSNRQRYFNEVDNALRKVLRQEQAPLILACTVDDYGVYRDLNEYPQLTQEFIPGNPELMRDEELREKGWKIAQGVFAREREEALGRLQNGLAHDFGVTEVEGVIRAAHDGLVDQFFVSAGQEAWGAYDAHERRVEIHEQRQPGDEDLLDLAALKVLTAGGAVWVMPAEEMPLGASAAATLRYPVPAGVVHS